MKKVSWPTKSETNRLTGVVLAVCGLVVAILTAMSYAFETITNLITRGSI
jgi:preprotein translocase SecE subunit